MIAFTVAAKPLSAALLLAAEVDKAFIRLDAAGGRLQITATDNYCSVITSLPATCDEPLSALVRVEQTAKLIKQLDGFVTFRAQNGTVSVTSTDRSRHRLPTMDLHRFPEIDLAHGRETAIDGPLLASLLSTVAFAAETNQYGEERWKALELVAEGGVLSVTACCGARLANVTTPFDDEFRMLVPQRVITLLTRFAKDNEVVSLATTSNLLTAFSLTGSVTVRLSAWAWPNWKALILAEYAHAIELDPEPMTAALSRVLVACEKSMAQRVEFELKSGEAILTTASPDRGESREQVPITYNGSTLNLALAGNQLLEFLKQAKGVVCWQYTEGAPVRFTVAGSSLQYIQLPLRGGTP